MTHGPCGFVGSKTHEAHDLKRAHSFFAGQHEVDDAKPIAKRLIRVFKNCSGND